MVVERSFEGNGGVRQEHLMSRERHYEAMEEIESYFDKRHGIRELDNGKLIFDAERNIILKYDRTRGPAKPRKKLGYLTLIAGKITVKSEQIGHMVGERGVRYDPYLSYDDPDLGRPYENSEEALEATWNLINKYFAPRR